MQGGITLNRLFELAMQPFLDSIGSRMKRGRLRLATAWKRLISKLNPLSYVIPNREIQSIYSVWATVSVNRSHIGKALGHLGKFINTGENKFKLFRWR
ncbi:hypothetical protein AVEN_168348-1 [Araneus ventricosus]|uniref:Uncharacterized protein n=1 Tax=Araneus ventricosus TaxID=182803 RepID=A0A4Y2M8A7_ARAVE|nr:hypothetical protein AVEN_168348-1 [Araneus ventricosus]